MGRPGAPLGGCPYLRAIRGDSGRAATTRGSGGSPDSLGDAVFDCYDSDADIAWIHAGRTVRRLIGQEDGQPWSA
jgi:hypothetical protein